MLGLAIVGDRSSKANIMLKQHTDIIGEYLLDMSVHVFYSYLLYFLFCAQGDAREPEENFLSLLYILKHVGLNAVTFIPNTLVVAAVISINYLPYYPTCTMKL